MRLCESKNPFVYIWEDDQTRIDLGNRAQIQVVGDLKRKFPRSELISMSPRSSQRTDIEVAINQKLEIRVEVKYVKNMVTVYDALLHRGQRDAFLDWFVSRLPFNTHHLPFTELLAKMHEKDKTVGFVGDKGTAANSGKVPAWWLSSPQVMNKLRNILIKRYIDRGENYFAIVTTTGEVHYYHLQGPVIPALGDAPFPQIIRAKTDTYGRAPIGTIRAAVKAYLSL